MGNLDRTPLPNKPSKTNGTAPTLTPRNPEQRINPPLVSSETSLEDYHAKFKEFLKELGRSPGFNREEETVLLLVDQVTEALLSGEKLPQSLERWTDIQEYLNYAIKKIGDSFLGLQTMCSFIDEHPK